MKELRFLMVLSLVSVSLLLAGCGPSADDGANTSRQTPVVRAAEPESQPTSAPAVEARPTPFAQERAEAEKKARSFLKVEFKEINDKGYPMFKVTNLTGKDIDNISGGFRGEDASGSVVFATGHTAAVTGSPFLKAGDTLELSPYGVNRKPEVMKLLQDDPGSLKVFFHAREITYLDGSSESGLGTDL